MKTSTAILDPNQPGSTDLKLSWIWHSGRWLLLNDQALDSADPAVFTNPGADSNAGAAGNHNSSIPVPDPGADTDAAADLRPGTDPLTLHECLNFFSLSLRMFF